MAQPGAWPSPSDYSTAIQNPRHCFTDPELQAGQVGANALGLPLGASGNFAVVYRLQCPARAFAVRCFIRTVTDQQQRYDAISRYLGRFALPALVDFDYFAQGIRVHGHPYPLVRMEWIAGRQLQRAVADSLRQAAPLRRLAAQWRGLVAELAAAHIAHGDLQHANILVDASGSLRLVDYDGMFIPALRGKAPGEAGHPNYQHPERIEHGYYDENADAFSALVIYLSFLALSADPGLWAFHTGENLIFVAEDYQAPGRTPIWGRLYGSSEAEVRRLSATLAAFCRQSVATLPGLATALAGVPLRAAAVVAASPAPPPPRPVYQMPPRSVAPAASSAVICPRCERVNAVDVVYCEHCTHQLCGNRFCPRCDSSIPVKAHYCPECGNRL